MNWSDIFYLKDNELFWAIKPSKKVMIGDKAGCSHGCGYIQLRFDGRNYLAHRVIWEMHHGQIPEGMEIDHINHIIDDNRIENLRIVNRHENNKNKSLQSNNSSGFNGVRWCRKANKWRAEIKVNGKSKHLGFFHSFSDAVAERVKANEENCHHENHGAHYVDEVKK